MKHRITFISLLCSSSVEKKKKGSKKRCCLDLGDTMTPSRWVIVLNSRSESELFLRLLGKDTQHSHATLSLPLGSAGRVVGGRRREGRVKDNRLALRLFRIAIFLSEGNRNKFWKFLEIVNEFSKVTFECNTKKIEPFKTV